MSEPSELITDEMLSAYVDDELSDDERRRVEQIVAQNPRYAQLLQQLRSLRETLQDLPVQRADDEFTRRVLQRIATVQIEHATPSARQDAAPSAAQRTAADHHAPARRGERDWGRPLIWSALVLAAALLVMVLAPDAPRNVANAPERAEQRERAVERESAAGERADRAASSDTDDTPIGLAPPQSSAQTEVVDDVRLQQTPRSAKDESESFDRSLYRSEPLEESRMRRSLTEGHLNVRSGIASEQVLADLDDAEASQLTVVIQADTTTAQMSNLLARLQEDQIPVSSLDTLVAERDVRAMDATPLAGQSGSDDIHERLARTPRREDLHEPNVGEPAESTLPAGPMPETDVLASRVRLYVLEASPDEVRQSLARANVRAETVDSGPLGRLSMYFTVAPESSDDVAGRLPRQVAPAAASSAREADQRPAPDVPAASGPAPDEMKRDAVDATPATEAEHRPLARGATRGAAAGGTVGQTGRAAEPGAAATELDTGAHPENSPRAGLAAQRNAVMPLSMPQPAQPSARRVLLLLRIVDPSALPAAPAEPDR